MGVGSPSKYIPSENIGQPSCSGEHRGGQDTAPGLERPSWPEFNLNFAFLTEASRQRGGAPKPSSYVGWGMGGHEAMELGLRKCCSSVRN